MHPRATREEALQLIVAGLNDCEVARRIGLPRTTVRDMRVGRNRPPRGPLCPRCWRPARAMRFTSSDYAELLALYLCDGCISRGARTYCLRFALDARYPGIVRAARELLERSFVANRVGLVKADGGATAVVLVYSCHLPCLFPQHGSGKKHERSVGLEPWQEAIVASAPWSFLRGCIRADGCTFVNRTGAYAYLTYDFRNLSADILDLFASTCDRLGLRYSRYASRIRLNRRDSVDALHANVGLKA